MNDILDMLYGAIKQSTDAATDIIPQASAIKYKLKNAKSKVEGVREKLRKRKSQFEAWFEAAKAWWNNEE